MSEKKVVMRNVAIALGIVCIILAASLVGVVADYTSIISGKDSALATDNSQISNLNAQVSNLKAWLKGNLTQASNLEAWLNGNLTQVSNLKAWLNGNLTQISNLNIQISSLNSQLTILNTQILVLSSELKSLSSGIITMANSSVWYNGTVSEKAGSYFPVKASVFVTHGGYVAVTIQSSTTTNLSVEEDWSYALPPPYVNLEIQVTVSTVPEMVLFPVYSNYLVSIYVGNTNLVNSATETVTITYYTANVITPPLPPIAGTG